MKTKSVKLNFLYQMIYQVLSFALPLVTSPYISRVIGAEGLGVFTYSYTIAFYFVLVAMLGISNHGNREIARCRDNAEQLNKTFSGIVSIHTVISIIVLVVYVVYASLTTNDQQFAMIQTIYVASAVFNISWFYFGIEEFKITVTVSSVLKIINALAVFMFVHTRDDLVAYTFIMAIGALVEQLVLWVPLRKRVCFVKPELREMLMHVKPLIVLFIPAIAVSLYKYMDKIMIGGLSNKVQLGLYENAEKIINIPMSIITSFGTVMLPKMANLASKTNQDELYRYIKISMRYVMCLAFALAFGLAGIGTTFAPWFWGDEFLFSGILIMALAITIPFTSFANVIRTQYLIPQKKDKQYLTSVLIGASLNLIVNLSMIPRWGAVGATVGTIIAECMVCISQVYIVRKELHIRKYIEVSFAFFVVGCIMFVCVYFLGQIIKPNFVALLVQVSCGIAIYATASFAIMYLTKDSMILSLVEKIRKQ